MQTEPSIVYKYRNWIDNNHKDVLLKNQLYFSSPKDFNDPFDCTITPNLSLLDSEEKVRQYAHQLRDDNEKTFPKSQVEDLVQRLLINRKKEQEFLNQLYFEGRADYYGVLSLTEKWNNILMWSHYADCHRGFCVGYWLQKFKNQNIFSGGLVDYPKNDDFPVFDPLHEDITTDFFTQSHSKGKDWCYEDEYRLLNVFYPSKATKEDRTVVIPDNFFAEIVIGINASEETTNEILNLAKRKEIKVYQAVKVPYKFLVGREEIQ